MILNEKRINAIFSIIDIVTMLSVMVARLRNEGVPDEQLDQELAFAEGESDDLMARVNETMRKYAPIVSTYTKDEAPSGSGPESETEGGQGEEGQQQETDSPPETEDDQGEGEGN